MSQHPPSHAGHALDDHWVAETIRLRESLWGNLEDSAESRRARALGNDLTHRVLLRARFLAQREGLDRVVARWRRGALFTTIAMLIAALLAGGATAAAALGNGTQSVNLPLALAALLGIQTLTLLLWLAGLALGRGQGSAWLGETWLWLTQRLARGPDTALAPTALAALLGRHNSLRWLLGAISHATWLAALTGMLLCMLALLSVRSYTFHWETTLLPADVFVQLAAILGWLPAQLGFHVPSEAIVRLSGTVGTSPGYAQAAWSSWLAGCVIAYGLIPRLLAFCACIALGGMRLRTTLRAPAHAIDPSLARRLVPASEHTGTDAPDQPDPDTAWTPSRNTAATNPVMIVGIELPPDTPWPPAGLAPEVHDAGMVDTRAQRNALLERLHRQPADTLLLVCDARQTPDRGVIALLAELAGLARQTDIILSGADTGPRGDQWRQKLVATGFPAEQLHQDIPRARHAA